MSDSAKTKSELLQELRKLRRETAALQKKIASTLHPDTTADAKRHFYPDEMLHEREEKYLALFESANDAIFTMDLDTFIDCNPMTLTMFGCRSKDEIIQHHPWEFSPVIQPDGRPSLASAKEKIDAALSGTPQRFYWKHSTLHGELFDAEVALNRIDIGSRTLLLAIVRNITEEWNIRRELHASEQRYRNIIDHAPIGFYQTKLSGEFITANNTLSTMLGYSSVEELLSKNISTDVYVTPEYRKQLIINYTAQGYTGDTEVLWKKKDGSTIWVQLNIHTVYDDHGTILNFDGFVRDITERKKHEDTVRESEQRYRSLFDQMLDGVYRSTHDGRFVAVNPAMAAMFGYSSIDEMMKVDIKKDLYFAPADRASHSLDTGQELIEEYLMKRKDGSPIWVEDHGRYVYAEDGSILYHEGMVRDITDRKIAEKIHRESEARFKAIFEDSPIMIFVIATDGTVVSLNSVAEQQLQYTKEELTGKNILSIFYPDDVPIVERQLTDLRSKKIEKGNWQVRKVTKEGKVIWVNENSRLIRWTDGNDIVLVTCEDITQQKLNDSALRKIEEENRAIVDAVPDIIFRIDRDGVFIDFRNPSRSPLYAAPEMFIGKKITEVLPSDLSRTALEMMERAFTSRKVETFEYELELNSEKRYFDDRIVAINDREALSFIRDITERKRSEQALKENEYWLRESQRVGKIGSYVLNINEDSWTSSHILNEIFGIDEHTVKNIEAWVLLVHPDDREEMEEYFTQYVLAGRHRFNKEYRIVRKRDGQVRWVWGLGELLLDEQGVPQRMIGTIQDITERNILQNQLLQSQKVQSIGILAGGIAHDFNNILAIILAYTSRIGRGSTNPQQLPANLEAINNAVERGAGLVKQILTFARQTEISFKPLMITDVTHEICSMLRETFPKTIIIEEVIRSAVSPINADKNQIHQTLLNLCVNARDAMPHGGTITITVDELQGEFVRQQVQDAQDGSYVCISVSDTGTGMSEEIQQHIFDPFFTTKDKGKGTGLGLSVVYGVIQNHGGYIQVQSTPNAGTTFVIYLPVIPQSDASNQVETPDISIVPGGTETLLLVEDEPLLRDFLETTLRGKGYTVMPAADGEEAVELFRKHHQEIDLVVTDIGLPKISGIDEFKEMKLIDPAVKVILASGFFEPEAKAQLVRDGAEGFIQKPYNSTMLLLKVREILDGKRKK